MIAEAPCETKEQLRKIEGQYIRNEECMNKRIEGRSTKEWCAENKERISENNKEYYKNNIEKNKNEKRLSTKSTKQSRMREVEHIESNIEKN